MSGAFPFCFNLILTHTGCRMQFGGYLRHLTQASPFLVTVGGGGSITGGSWVQVRGQVEIYIYMLCIFR